MTSINDVRKSKGLAPIPKGWAGRDRGYDPETIKKALSEAVEAMSGELAELDGFAVLRFRVELGHSVAEVTSSLSPNPTSYRTLAMDLIPGIDADSGDVSNVLLSGSDSDLSPLGVQSPSGSDDTEGVPGVRERDDDGGAGGG